VTQPREAGASLPREAVTELRHELRTPVNHIVGYAEMLLEDLGPDSAERRSALEETLAAARDVLSLISNSLPTTRTEVDSAEVAALYESLRAPQQRIIGLLAPLLDRGTDDEEFAADVQRILNAAERLVSAEPTAAAAPKPEPAAEADDGDAAARILVVDDVEDNRELLKRRLKRQGHAVDCAKDGRVALEMIGAQAYDLVLLDVMMPEIDGFEVLERLKGSPATRDLPVIMISAIDELGSIARCIERGAEDYLPKPFDPVLLRARINASLEKKRLRDLELEYLDQVKRVIQAATAVEQGIYDSGVLKMVTDRGDELGRLARVFDQMADEVQNREERLRRQVEDLKSEIDAVRQAPSKGNGPQLDFAKLPEGERFAGRYEVLATLGNGAMGVVYRARDLELDEDVAIKTLRPDLVRDPTHLERFKTEIRLARRISHRNVVRTHDFGECAGVYYLTMEHVEGITVRDMIDSRGQLEVSSTLAIASQLATALDVAHEQGVIHRDIKPQNMLLDDEGILKVMDFGVARLAEGTSTITETGLVVGTPAYMSPEQLLSDEIDSRSDLYAVGVVLYECLTGVLPFEARSPVSLIAKVLNEEPSPPATLNAEVPPALSALVLQLLGKRPEERPTGARELSERLAQIG
jgi:CheY-like chemotaxis protein